MKKWFLAIVLAFAAIATTLYVSNAFAVNLTYHKMPAGDVKGVYNQTQKSSILDLDIKDDMTPTHVILDQNKVGLYYACYNYMHPEEGKYPGYSVTFGGETNGKFNCYHYDPDNSTASGHNAKVFPSESFGMSYAIAHDFNDANKPKTTKPSLDFSGPDNYIKLVAPEAATDVERQIRYDVHITLSEISIKTFKCEDKTKNRTISVVAFGWGEKMQSGYSSYDGISEFVAHSLNLASYHRCGSAVKYNVSVELYPSGTTENKATDRLMLWAVADIDIPDKTGSSDATYDSSHTYAEHLKFLRDDNGHLRGAVRVNDEDEENEGDRTKLKTYISMVKTGGTATAPTGALSFSNDTLFHNQAKKIDDNSGSALFVLNTSDIAFEWGGSECGTTIVSAPYSKFVGKTVIRYGDRELTDGSNRVTVHGKKSEPVSFEHYIAREQGFKDNEPESFTISRSDWRYNTQISLTENFSLSDGTGYKKVYDTATAAAYGGSGGYVVSLSPGQAKTYFHNLKYRITTVNSATESVGVNAIRLFRPEATFAGSVTPFINDAEVENNASVEVTSADGTYTVKFRNSIKRNDDGAGDTVGSGWTADLSRNGAVLSDVEAKHGTAEREEEEEKSDDIDEIVYSGYIRYGETIRLCGNLRYDSVVNYNGNSTDNAQGCVVLWRGSGHCSFDDRFEYGLNHASNTGRIGVQNKDLANAPSFTVPNDLTSVSVYARPTDNVRFFYDMCAGSMYPIKQKGLSTTVTYKASGMSTKSSSDGNGYLFRKTVPVENDTFFNPRFWTNGNDGYSYRFVKEDVEASFSSPSDEVGTNYRCGGSTVGGWYQIAGKQDCARNSVYDLGVIDAGSVITQKLEWNEQAYNGTTFSNAPRSAEANVIVPYNYVLKPFVTNNSGNTGKVAYIGETLTMTPGVVTVPRTNVFPVGGSQNYATITKPTDITVKYYFKTSSGSVISEHVVESSSRSQARLNSDGLVNGTVSTDSQKSVDDGGTQLPATTVQIPNSGVNVGDKVCVEVSVYPADSHDAKDATVVSGAGVGDIALSETSADGNNRVTAVSCSTIAKKPTMSVESSNAYSATQFKTARYTRTIGSKKFNFGSWSEYGVFGRVLTDASANASLFASGAALGYSRDGYPGQAANVARANDESSADNNKVSTAANSSKCTFMTQTFANAECNSSYSSLGWVMASQYEQRIKERYSSSAGTFEMVGLGTREYSGATYYDVSGYSGTDVIVEPSGIVRFDSKYNLYINSLPNITNEQYASKNITTPNRTIVYSAPEKSIVIDGNLNYDGGAKNSTDGITQVIIIAKNVYFTSNPTYVNAIIIADQVNTCRFSGASKVAVGGQGSAEILSSNQCNQALRFDSPVIVKKLVLNRTAGADNGDDAIRRAEIFNLNMANYLWSFNQMSRLSQATTTYSRELPTRY